MSRFNIDMSVQSKPRTSGTNLPSQKGNKFYILKSGKCDVVTQAQGKTSELVKGRHFGEFALMDDIPRMATIMPTEDCELLTMDRERFA